MATIHSIGINNFRGFKSFYQSFYNKKIICLVGRGDTGKTTLLEAISYVLSPKWNLSFYDSDFYNCNTSEPIVIEVTLTNLPDYFFQEKYGLFLRGIRKDNGVLIDDLENEECYEALTIKLEVTEDLEPQWSIVNTRQDPVSISAVARARLNAFLISDFTDNHFSWSKGSPLYSLFNKSKSDGEEESNIVLKALREAKMKVDENPFLDFTKIINQIQKEAFQLGVNLTDLNTSIDFKDISIRDNRVCLHDELNVPIRQKGKGSKRLVSFAIQSLMAAEDGIVLIDEIEQGLEPDRVQHLVSNIKKRSNGQVFITTHSSNVVVELDATDFYLVRKGESTLVNLNSSLQKTIRQNPEALFARKLIVCEGATEVGICRALNSYRIEEGKTSASYEGVRFVDGGGSQFVEYCKGFQQLGYNVCAFCDSDDGAINSKKKDLIAIGVSVIDCDDGNAIENQIFNDLPTEGVKDLINYRVDNKSVESVEQTVENQFGEKLPGDWRDNITAEIREALGKASTYKKMKKSGGYEDKSWFKRIDHGMKIGSIVCKYLNQMNGEKLKTQFDKLSNWIENE